MTIDNRAELSPYRSSLAITGVSQVIGAALETQEARDRIGDEAYGHSRHIQKVDAQLGHAVDLVQAQIKIAQDAVMGDVELGALSIGDGLRLLAGLPTYFDGMTTSEQLGRGAESRIRIVNELIKAGDGEPALIIMADGSLLAFPGNTLVEPALQNAQAGINIGFAEKTRAPQFLAFTTLTPTVDGELQTSDVVAGRRDVGSFLRQNSILSGGILEVGAKGHNDLRRTIRLLTTLAETDQDLADYGFTIDEVNRLTNLWADLVTNSHPLGRALSLPDLLAAMPAIDSRGAPEHLLNALQTMGSRFFEVAASDGVGFLGYRQRLLELYQTIYGPIAGDEDRTQVLKNAARLALFAPTTPDRV